MEFTKNELEDIVEVLANSGNESAIKMAHKLAEMMQNDSESNVYNLINQKPYIASVLWDVDDIKEVLSEKGFTTTDENVAIVCRTGIVEALEDRLGGWDIIGWFVSDVRDRLEKKIEKKRILVLFGLSGERYEEAKERGLTLCIFMRKLSEEQDGSVDITIAAIMAERFHLFPFRTQKLSFLTPKVLCGTPLGRIGHRRFSVFIRSL